jgi:hypothetical protein
MNYFPDRTPYPSGISVGIACREPGRNRQKARQAKEGEEAMAERVTGPYRGYYISASARLVRAHGEQDGGAPIYVGSVSLARGGPDDVHRFEALVDLGPERRFATESGALAHVEQAARDYIDRSLQAT